MLLSSKLCAANKLNFYSKVIFNHFPLLSKIISVSEQPNMNEIYSNLPFSKKDFLHLKCKEYFIIGQNMSSFHL